MATAHAVSPLPSPFRNGFFFSKGRVALYALLRALNVGPSDEVILPIFTCPAVVEPIAGLRARAVFCDIEKAGLGPSPEHAASLITYRTKVIIVQHTFGIPARLHQLLAVARTKGIALLEDCCHVSASTYCGNQLGRFGDAAFSSHDWGKPLSVGGGGVAIVNSPSLLEAVQKAHASLSRAESAEQAMAMIRDAPARIGKLMRQVAPSLAAQLRSRLYPPRATHPLDWEELQLGSVYSRRIPWLYEKRLRRLLTNPTPRISARRWAAERYEAGLRNIGIRCFKCPADSEVTFWRYPFFTKNKSKVLAEARRRYISLYDWGTIPFRVLNCAASGVSHNERRFAMTHEVVQNVLELIIDERRERTEIDRTLDFLSTMRRNDIL